MIEFRNVTKVFGQASTAVRAVDRLSFHQPKGTFWALTGPSGSGKSTVLHLIAGLTPATSGTIVVDGQDIGTSTADEAAVLRRRRIGYVLQTFGLLPFLSAADNVAMPLVLDGLNAREAGRRARDVLALVDMHHRADHNPNQLSGGEQQRIAIARALVIDPAIVLADEPTGNLDRAAGTALMELVQDINERTKVTILLVTHDPLFAACATRVLRLLDGALEQTIDLAGTEREPE